MNESPIWWKTEENRFNTYSGYLKHQYKEKVYRVSVDAGFSCPNRGEDRQQAGCIYCDERGAAAPYLGNRYNISEQVKGTILFLKKRYGAMAYILYFQAFSGTYASVEKLKEIYDYALSLGEFREIIISTRPDCIDREKADLISSYREKGLVVWVELGLQSASNKTLDYINRGHTVEQFREAYDLLKTRGIKVAVHLIFGLPGEGDKEIMENVRYVTALKPDALKFHNLHIPKNTLLHDEFMKGEITAPGPHTYLKQIISALEIIPPETVVMRLTCDTYQRYLTAPRNFWVKSKFLIELRKELIRRDTWQGRLY